MFRSAFRLSAVLFAIATVITACETATETEDSLTQEEQAAVGTYALITGNGSNLPIATGSTAEGNCSRFIDRGQLLLQGDREYKLSLDMRAQCSNPVASTALESGRWSLSGSTVTFVSGGSGSPIRPGNGTLTGGTITTTINMEWVGQLPPVTLILRR